MERFRGKIALITGGGSGLGRECALQWAAEGAAVVVSDLSEPRAVDVATQIVDKGGQALGVRADVTVEGDVEEAVGRAVREFGGIDILLANAGKGVEGFGAIPLEDITEAQWDDVNDANFKGVFLSAKQACREMKTRGGGNIVVTVSAGGFVAYPGFGPYCAGKAGVVGLIRSMALEWGRYGIRVNGFAPTHGMSVNFALPPDAPVLGLSYEEYGVAQSGAAWNPALFPAPLKVDRPPSLRDNAAVATFLASDDSAYMSGVTIPSCDGGTLAISSIPFPENWSLDRFVTDLSGGGTQ